MSKKASPGKPSGNKLFSLKDVANYPNKIASTLGVILDCTGTYKTDDSFDYVTKLRIIDPTFNPKNSASLKTEMTIYVFIYTKTEAEAPSFRQIGDIILLRNFLFDNYQTKQTNMIRGNYNKSCSEWQVFDSRLNANVQAINKSRTIPSKIFLEEHEQIKKLKEWLNVFFINNSLKDLQWYHSEFPNHINFENVYQLKDVDIILKVLASVKIKVNGINYHKIVFADEDKQLYFSELSKQTNEFEVDRVVKLRSVVIINWNGSYKIEFYNYSSITLIPNHFKDAKELLKKTVDIKFLQSDLENQFFEELHLEKYNKQQIGPNIFVYTSPPDKSGKKIKETFLETFPELERYDLSCVEFPHKKKSVNSFKTGSVVLREYADLPITPLKEIIKILNDSKNNEKVFNANLKESFKIRVKICDIQTSKIDSLAKIYSTSLNRLWNFNELDVASLASKDNKVVIYTNFSVMDNSIKEKGFGLPIYIVTFDGNPENIFDLWKLLPECLNVNGWVNIKAAKEKKFVEAFNSLKNSNMEFDFIINLVKNEQNEVYFRIVNSLFWFLNTA